MVEGGGVELENWRDEAEEVLNNTGLRGENGKTKKNGGKGWEEEGSANCIILVVVVVDHIPLVIILHPPVALNMYYIRQN